MTKVFIGGSRRLSRLSSEVRRRLDNIVDKSLPVLIGDANGADAAIQGYFLKKGYGKVEVFCVAGHCRNNLGNWPVRSVVTESKQKNFNFYSAKDRLMTQEATVGLMIWDGKSLGTLLNVMRLLNQGKSVVVYDASQHRFWQLKNLSDWEGFMVDRDQDLRTGVERKGRSEIQQVLVHTNQPVLTR
jgi:hypothetical protein